MSTAFKRVRQAVGDYVQSDGRCGFLGRLECVESTDGDENDHGSFVFHLQSDGLLVLNQFSADTDQPVKHSLVAVDGLDAMRALGRVLAAAIQEAEKSQPGGGGQ